MVAPVRDSRLGTRPSRPTVIIPESLIATSDALLTQRSPSHRHEDVVYWAGLECGGKWIMLSCIRPAAQVSWGSFKTSAKANAQVVGILAEMGLGLLAQLHTHPGHFVDHSEGDELGAFMAFENFISIVVPHHGQRGMLPLVECGVHRLENRAFRRLNNDEIARSLRVIPLAKDLRSNA
jgi:hypothetical protein